MLISKVLCLTSAAAISAVGVFAAAPAAQAAPGDVTLTFQVDRYMPKTAAQAVVTNRVDDDDILKYREDKALWGASAWQFVNVTVPADIYNNADDDVYYNYIAKQINKKTNSKVGDILTTYSTGTSYIDGVKKGQGITVAWLLHKDAKPTVNMAWGAKKNLSQNFFGRSSVKLVK